MLWIVLVVALVVSFSGILLFGAPYLPTLSPQVDAALKLANLKKGQTLLELGCGDGKVVIAAARKGYRVIGYELNPFLFVIAWLRARPYRKTVKIVLADFWRIDLPAADAVFVFLLPKYMKKLDKKFIQYKHKPVKLVSFAFTVPDKKAAAHDKGVFLYMYK